MNLARELFEEVSRNGAYQLRPERCERQIDAGSDGFERHVHEQIDDAAIVAADQLRREQVKASNGSKVFHLGKSVAENFRRIAGIENRKIVVRPAVHNCFAPCVREFQSSDCDMELAESSCAKIADQQREDSACSYRSETARHIRQTNVGVIDSAGVGR